MSVKQNVINIGGGTNPVGTIISFYGLTPPDGYLSCDGTEYNRIDYPELANHLVTQFADLVGDGEMTFKVPDLRGEFLRGTGINSHSGQGSGSTVGVHQGGTVIPYSNGGSAKYLASAIYTETPVNSDYTASNISRAYTYSGVNLDTYGKTIVVRPTNTSILYCIKY